MIVAEREDELALRAAKCAALKAWAAIEPYYGGTFEIHATDDGPSTTADRLADQILCRELQAIFPPAEYGYLTEETKDDFQRLERERVWIIDPIDGTNDFIEKTGMFCIQIGLVRRTDEGYQIVAALLYDPPNGRFFTALAGRGAFLESDTGGVVQRLSVNDRQKDLRALVSRSHITPDVEHLVRALGASEMVPYGSVGLKVAQLALGEADFYVSTAIDKTKEWDSCAPQLVLTEAGGMMTDLGGEALPYNGRNVRHAKAFIASNGACHDALIQGIREHFANAEVLAPKLLRERLGIVAG